MSTVEIGKAKRKLGGSFDSLRSLRMTGFSPPAQPALLPRVGIDLDLAIDLQHGFLQSGDDLRVLKGNVSAFTGISFQIVEFEPNQLGGLNQLESARPRKKMTSRRMSASGALDCSAVSRRRCACRIRYRRPRDVSAAYRDYDKWDATGK